MRQKAKLKIKILRSRIRYGEPLLGLFELFGKHEQYWLKYWPRKQALIDKVKQWRCK